MSRYLEASPGESDTTAAEPFGHSRSLGQYWTAHPWEKVIDEVTRGSVGNHRCATGVRPAATTILGSVMTQRKLQLNESGRDKVGAVGRRAPLLRCSSRTRCGASAQHAGRPRWEPKATTGGTYSQTAPHAAGTCSHIGNNIHTAPFPQSVPRVPSGFYSDRHRTNLVSRPRLLTEIGGRDRGETAASDWPSPNIAGRASSSVSPIATSSALSLSRPPLRRRRQLSVSSAAQPGPATASPPTPSRAPDDRRSATAHASPRPLHERTAGGINKEGPAPPHTLGAPNCPSVRVL
ncbi:hypothetical protein K458DRAFT_208594 [Lentithecium fluviatile CBS 122367]|uniref:Uncharacterized protein n=1 Tax=Lentithecium fluviatile CBS 122367 TaxID=1168545 RepID=A0A6G1J7E6_9PLEO|nr:hypothetical protein K458DRAFT_208594 [Lentithecium fluviatile CBS 122367]